MNIERVIRHTRVKNGFFVQRTKKSALAYWTKQPEKAAKQVAQQLLSKDDRTLLASLWMKYKKTRKKAEKISIMSEINTYCQNYVPLPIQLVNKAQVRMPADQFLKLIFDDEQSK